MEYGRATESYDEKRSVVFQDVEKKTYALDAQGKQNRD